MEIAVARRKRYFVHYLKTVKTPAAGTLVGPKSDPQQLRLYAMEREEIGARDYARLTFAECGRVIRSVCRAYGIPRPRLFRRKLRHAAEWWKPPGQRYSQIILSTAISTSHDLLTILHELAHHVHFYLADQPEEDEDHGPEFMACYISIFDTVRFLPKDALATVCDRRGLRYFLPGPTVDSLRRVLNQ